MDMQTTVTADPAFRADVMACFQEERWAIPARWLYDRRGSELFERITELPEYYPTRTETALLQDICDEVGEIVGPGRAVVEFGSGSSAKTPHLLRAIDPAAYVPIDISGEFLEHSAGQLEELCPDLPILPVEADFMQPLILPEGVKATPKIGFFPGSTIGNMIPRSAVDLLRSMHATLGVGSYLLIGMDRVKDVEVLIPAYDDAAGVTAQFTLNLLHRINRELDATIPVGKFRHVASWNDVYARIEVHLEAVEDVAFAIDGQEFAMVAGQRIHAENSHKYGLRDARLLLRAGGWTPVTEWSDPQDWFSLFLVEACPSKHAP